MKVALKKNFLNSVFEVNILYIACLLGKIKISLSKRKTLKINKLNHDATVLRSKATSSFKATTVANSKKNFTSKFKLKTP